MPAQGWECLGLGRAHLACVTRPTRSPRNESAKIILLTSSVRGNCVRSCLKPGCSNLAEWPKARAQGTEGRPQQAPWAQGKQAKRSPRGPTSCNRRGAFEEVDDVQRYCGELGNAKEEPGSRVAEGAQGDAHARARHQVVREGHGRHEQRVPRVPGWSKPMKWAALEAASSSTRGSGWALSGPASPWECRAAQSRQARLEEAQEPSWGMPREHF